jgi:catechol 2,3-dioxygenase-like lactoylglutathione lyase family enzyme
MVDRPSRSSTLAYAAGMLDGIDNVGVAVSDLARSVAFYERLGFTKDDDYDADVQGASMRCGSAVLFLFQTKLNDPPRVGREPSLAHNPPGLDHVSFTVGDIDADVASLRERGIVFDGEPEDQDWGARLVGFRDPDGTNLYLLQYLDTD